MVRGQLLSVRLFGESHGPAVGAVIEGFPAGFRPDMTELRAFLARRAPRGDGLTTTRRESDEPEILSGLYQGATTGTPLAVIFRNRDARPEDYAFLPDLPRPGHADYPAFVRSGGAEDLRGGGHHSGRLTLPLVFAGGLALQWLKARGVRVGSHLASLGGMEDTPLDPADPDFAALAACAGETVPAMSASARAAMEKALRETAGDSLGAVVECAAAGLPAGLCGPEGLKAALGAALFSIPAVKGVEFGAGFASARMTGSACNDPYTVRDGQIVCTKNDAGGLLGGMTDGMPVIARAAFRPTPSVAAPQRTVSLSRLEEEALTLSGRHDPCCALRALPAVEAAFGLVLMDAWLERLARRNPEEEWK